MNPLLLEAIITALFTYYLYNQYVSKYVNIQITILVLLVWFLTFFSIFILPLDIYYTNFNNNNSNSNAYDLVSFNNIEDDLFSKNKTLFNNNNSNLLMLNNTEYKFNESALILASNNYKNKAIQDIIKLLWTIIYWVVYALSWLIIPIYQEYEAAGDFYFSSKLKRSLKRNAIFYFALSVFGSCFISYLIFSKKFTM